MNTPTVIVGALNDKELKDNITALVNHVEQQTERMTKSFDSAIDKMKSKLAELGSQKIDFGVSGGGSSSRRVSAQKDEADAVKQVTEETKKRTQATKELTLTLDQQYAAIRNAVVKAPEVRTPDMAKSARESFQAFYKAFNEQARQLKPLIDAEAFRQQLMPYIRSIEQAKVKIQELYLEEKELHNLSLNRKVSNPHFEEYWNGKYNARYDRVKESERLIELEKKYQELVASAPSEMKQMAEGMRLQVLNESIEQAKNKIQSLYEKEKELKSQSKDIKVGSVDFERIFTQIQSIKDERAKEGQLLLQLERDRQNLVAQGVQPFEKQKQSLQEMRTEYERVTTAMKDGTTTSGKQVDAEKQKTAEIKKQADAIRKTKEWQEKGFVVQGDTVYYDKDRANVSKHQKEQLLSLEEQIVQAQQKEAEEAQRAAQATEKQVQAQRQVQQAAIGTAQITENVHQTQERANRTMATGGKVGGGTTAFQSYEDLRQAIASVLKLQENEIKLADAETASYNNLSATLKQLQAAYNALNKSDRNSDQGKALLASIHETERAIQQIRAQASRPVNLQNALGLSEKTLDDIAYKMRQLSSYRSGLNVDTQRNEINQVNTEYDRLKKKMDEVMQKNTQMINSNNALGRSWNYMKNRLAFYFTVGASTAFVKNLIEVRSQYEMNERALGILINSAERGTQIFNELSQMALVSPYTLIELSAAAKQLTAYDVAAKDVVDTTRRLADMASAVGVPIDRLTYALGQIKAYGYLNSRDTRMFANAGIPLVKQLADHYTELEGKLVSTADVYDRIKKKAIDYNDVMQVITKMTDEGGKFFDFQAKMADTLKVRLANFTLAWNNMLNDIGASNQGFLVSGINLLTKFLQQWRTLDKVIWNLIGAFGAFKAAQVVFLMTTQKVGLGLAAMEVAGKRLTNMFYGIGNAAKSLIGNWQLMLAAMLAYAAVDIITTTSRNSEAIRKFNEDIAKGAEEASKSIDEFLKQEALMEAKATVMAGKKLSPVDAKKTWDALREEIEKSSIASDQLIPKLLDITDINQRLSAAFTMAEDLRDVQGVLSGLENELKIDQDTAIGGLFGEGLAEDLEDYTEHMEKLDEVAEFSAKKHRGFWESVGMLITTTAHGVSEAVGSSYEEAKEEAEQFAKDTAKTIKETLGEDGVKNATKLAEAIARVRQQIESDPKIRGRGRILLEQQMDEVFAAQFAAYDKQAVVAQRFLEQLKKDYGSAFNGITTDILDKSDKWNKGQIDAFRNTAEKLKKDIPEAWSGIVDEMLKDLNSRDWTVRVMAKYDVTELSDLQLAFKKRFLDVDYPAADREKQEAENQARWGKFQIKQNEDNVTYEKRITDEKNKQQGIMKTNLAIMNKTKDQNSVAYKNAKQQYDAAEQFLNDAKMVEQWGGYSFVTKTDNKGAKQAESELQKALKEELSLIDKVRSTYKELTKEGMSSQDAITKATAGFGESVASINQTFAKFGLTKLDLTKFAGVSNPREIVVMLQEQLNRLIASGRAKPAEIKDLQVKIKDLNVDAEKYDLTKITKGLNNELDMLKDEYELAVELDANPELGSMFADMWGINTETLPHTVKDYADEYTRLLNKYLKDIGSTLILPHLDLTNDDLTAFEEQVKSGVMNEEWFNAIKKGVEAVRAAKKKDFEESAKEWDKLLEKYSEYEYKQQQIQKNANQERQTFVKHFGTNEQYKQAMMLNAQIDATEDPVKRQELQEQLKKLVADLASGDDTKIQLVTSIDTKEAQEQAKLSFEEFQKSPEWITATGDLAGMTHKAIGGLIDDLQTYKKNAKNLDPKQIKSINKALASLYKQQRSGNPFHAIADAMDEAKLRAGEFDEKIEKTQAQIDKLENTKDKTAAQIKSLENLKKVLADLKNKQKEAGAVDATTIVSGINDAIAVANQAAAAFGEMFEALGGNGNTKAAETIKQVSGILDKGVQGAAIGAQIGGGYGAIIGAAVGVLQGVITTFADQWSGNKSITKQVEKSERAVKRLELVYIDLEHAVSDAYGTATIGAQKAAIANKELQLAELKRQLTLEQSRKEKNKDEDRIIELQKQIKELEYDIKDATNEIVNDLLGISSVGDAMESLMDGFIEALRNGEDAMAVFDESVDDMIANMVKKMFVAKIVQPWFEKQWDKIQQDIDKRTEGTQKELKSAMEQLANMKEYANKFTGLKDSHVVGITLTGEFVTLGQYKQLIKIEEGRIAALQERLTQESTPTVEDIARWAHDLRDGKATLEDWQEYLKQTLVDLGLMNKSKDKNLSALQQGIQGITEDTAGALEAYMNGVSQQVYLHSDLLTQIRDTIIGFDLDVQTAIQSQMLLQLRDSYQVQMSIQNILEGWTSANGLAVRVEMV